jgi:hypothetical protein
MGGADPLVFRAYFISLSTGIGCRRSSNGKPRVSIMSSESFDGATG